MATFKEIEPKLCDATLEVIDTVFGFRNTTPVQRASISLFLKNKDVCAEAVTGSGKTLAFVIPVIETLQKLTTPLRNDEVGAVIVSPTRELATQTFNVIKKFTDHTSYTRQLVPQLLVGGTNVQSDLDKLTNQGCHILVATPGRIVDILKRTKAMEDATIVWKTVEVLVLDEADTLLDMGFQDDLTTILSSLPKQRRTGLFSATQTQQVKALARAGLRNPAVIAVRVQATSNNDQKTTNGPQKIPLSLQNFYVTCKEEQKLSALSYFLRTRICRACPSRANNTWGNEKIIVFFLTCASVEYFSRVLPHAIQIQLKQLGFKDIQLQSGMNESTNSKKRLNSTVKKETESIHDNSFPIFALHGRLSSNRRTQTYNSFLNAPRGVLFCTDVAARGIDIPDVEWIVQFDPPSDPSFFVHRVGRTARAGRSGLSLTFLLPQETEFVDLMSIQHVPMKLTSLPSIATSTIDSLPKPLDDTMTNESDISLGMNWERANISQNKKDAETERKLANAMEKESLYSSGNNQHKSTFSKQSKGAGAAVQALRSKTPAIADAARERVARAAAVCDEAASTAAKILKRNISQDTTSPKSQHKDETLIDVTPALLATSLRDRDVLERGTRAFISFVRGYKEHQCRYIFRLQVLDLPSTARCFGLLQLPHLKDLRGTNTVYEGLGVIVDTSVIKFLDKSREKVRKQRLKQEAEASQTDSISDVTEQSLKTTEKPDRESGKGTISSEKAQRKALIDQANKNTENNKSRKRKGQQQKIFEEWDDLANEERLAKRYRQGKITEKEYNRLLMGVSSEESQDESTGEAEESEDDDAMSGDEKNSGSARKKQSIAALKQLKETSSNGLLEKYRRVHKRNLKRSTKTAKRAAVKHGLGVKLAGRKLKIARRAKAQKQRR